MAEVQITPGSTSALGPDGFVDTEGDAILAALLKDVPPPVDEVVEEYLAKPLPVEPVNPDAGDKPDVDEADQGKSIDPADEDAKRQAKEPDENARGMLRLMEREDAVVAKEKAFEEKQRAATENSARLEKRLAELEATLESTKQTAVDYTALRRKLLTAPVKFLEEELKIPPDQVTRIIIAQKLGDAAPPELVRLAKDKQVEIELQDIRDELARERQALKVERSRGTVDEHLTKGESKYPTLSAVAKVDRARVSKAVFAKVKAVLDTGAELDEAAVERAAKEVEEDWSVFSKAFMTTTPAPESKNVEAATKNVQPGSTTENKKRVPPPRKAPYWEQASADDQAYVDSVMLDVMRQVKNK